MNKYIKKVENAFILPAEIKGKLKLRLQSDIPSNADYKELCNKYGNPQKYAYELCSNYYDEQSMIKFHILQIMYTKRKIMLILFFVFTTLGILNFITYPNNILRLQNSLFAFLSEHQINSLYTLITNLDINYALVCVGFLVLSIFSATCYITIHITSYLFWRSQIKKSTVSQ